MSAEQPLALIVDDNLVTRQYQRIREQAGSLYCKLYPPYQRVKEVKLLCYAQRVMMTKTAVKIPLQALIDHTLFRFCQVQEVNKKLHLYKDNTYDIVIKWECDGSEQKRYNQRFTEKDSTDESLLW